MRPNGHAVCSIKCISHRMVEMIVSVQCALHRHLAHHAKRIQLERRAGRGCESLNHQRGIFPCQKSAIANRGGTFRWVRDSRVQPISDFPHRSEALVYERCLRYTRIARDFRGEYRERNQFGRRIEGSKAGCAGDKFAPRKPLREVDHFSSTLKTTKLHNRFWREVILAGRPRISVAPPYFTSLSERGTHRTSH